MANAHIHSVSSQRKFGGSIEDYIGFKLTSQFIP